MIYFFIFFIVIAFSIVLKTIIKIYFKDLKNLLIMKKIKKKFVFKPKKFFFILPTLSQKN
jgi:hypothetical protein